METAMTAIKTDTKYNFQQAENDQFSWNTWDGTSGNTLLHKPSGRRIYQMQWCNSEGYVTDTVEGEVCEAVKAFWAELRKLQAQKPPRVEEDYDIESEPKHGYNGYCRKCHSYCYSDCEAN